MKRIALLMTVLAMVVVTGCAKYNVRQGRVGEPNHPTPLPPAGQADIGPVHFGHVQAATVPDLVTPITRTMWIKGHKRPNGDYVGDYPITCVFRKGEFVETAVPHPVVPRAVKVVTEEGQPPTASPFTPQVRRPKDQPRQLPETPPPAGLPEMLHQFQRQPLRDPYE